MTSGLPSSFVFQRGTLENQHRRIARWLGEQGVPSVSISYGELDTGTFVLQPGDLPAGSVQFISRALELADVEHPRAFDYSGMQPWMHRAWWTNQFSHRPDRRPVDRPLFIKPRHIYKAFTGICTDDPEFAELTAHVPPTLECLFSEKVEFVDEWRALVHDGCLLDINWYGHEPSTEPDLDAVLAMADAAYRTTGADGFCIDVGTLATGETALVEITDGWAFGGYGAPPADMLDVMWARWQQMTSEAPSAIAAETDPAN